MFQTNWCSWGAGIAGPDVGRLGLGRCSSQSLGPLLHPGEGHRASRVTEEPKLLENLLIFHPAFCPEKIHIFLLETPPSHHPTFLNAPVPSKALPRSPFPCFADVFRGLEGMQGGICAGKAQFAVLGAGLAEEGRIPAPRSCSPRWHRPWVGCLDQVHQLHFTDSHSQTWAFHGKYFASELK